MTAVDSDWAADQACARVLYDFLIETSYKREAKKGSEGIEAHRAQWAMKVGGASEIARSAQRRDYASFPDNVPRRGFRGEAPNVLQTRSNQRKSSQGAKRYLTGLNSWLFQFENRINLPPGDGQPRHFLLIHGIRKAHALQNMGFFGALTPPEGHSSPAGFCFKHHRCST